MGIFGKKKDKKQEERTVCSCSGNFDAKEEKEVVRGDAAAVSIKVLGAGCRNCQALLENTKEAVFALHLSADVEHVTDLAKMAQYGIMSTPALVVNEKVVSAGRVLKSADIEKLLRKVGIA